MRTLCLLAGFVLALTVCGAELRIAADRVSARPGETLRIALTVESSETVSVLQWNLAASAPLLAAGAPDTPAGPNKKIRCGPLGCLIYGEGHEAIPTGFAAWPVIVPHAARRGPIELTLVGLSAATPDGLPVELTSPTPLRIEVTEDGRPYFEASGVVNAASARQGLSPGGLVSIYGLGFTTAAAMENAGGAREFRGLSVWVNGVAAPILAVGRAGDLEQVNVQVPFEVVPGSAEIEIRNLDTSWRIGGINITAVSPGIFDTGGNRAAAIHGDGRLVTEWDPARPGEVVGVFLTGCGTLAAGVPTGAPGPEPAVSLAAAVTATVAGIPSRVDFAGYAPGLIGLCQVNLEVPPLAASDAILSIAVGGVSSNPVRLPIG